MLGCKKTDAFMSLVKREHFPFLDFHEQQAIFFPITFGAIDRLRNIVFIQLIRTIWFFTPVFAEVFVDFLFLMMVFPVRMLMLCAAVRASPNQTQIGKRRIKTILDQFRNKHASFAGGLIPGRVPSYLCPEGFRSDNGAARIWTGV